MSGPGVSFVVTVHNGERWLAAALDGVLAQADGRPFEVLAVDDGSTDGSRRILDGYAAGGRVRVLDGERRGAASAMNLGIRTAAHEFVALVDQDVLLARGWLVALVKALSAGPEVAAAQGWYTTPKDAGVLARVSGLDLEERYSRITRPCVDHVCTGNSLYRKSALEKVGLLDPTFGYGLDNDLAYRLTRAGFTLRFCPEAQSEHRWRESLAGWVRQQYGVAYGRLDVVKAHPDHATGDQVSRLRMILHVPVFLCAVLSAVAAPLAALLGSSAGLLVSVSGTLFCALVLERAWAASRAWRLSRDFAAWAIPVVHLLRDAVWLVALFRWALDRALGKPRGPGASM